MLTWANQRGIDLGTLELPSKCFFFFSLKTKIKNLLRGMPLSKIEDRAWAMSISIGSFMVGTIVYFLTDFKASVTDRLKNIEEMAAQSRQDIAVIQAVQDTQMNIRRIKNGRRN